MDEKARDRATPGIERHILGSTGWNVSEVSIEVFPIKKELTGQHTNRLKILWYYWHFRLTVCASTAFGGEKRVDITTTGSYYHTIDILRLWGLPPILRAQASGFGCQQEAFYMDTVERGEVGVSTMAWSEGEGR